MTMQQQGRSQVLVELIESGVAELAIHGRSAATRDRLIGLLKAQQPAACIRADTPDPSGFGLVVNGMPAGMKAGDPLLPVIAGDQLGLGAGEFGLLSASFGVGPIAPSARRTCRGCATPSCGRADCRTRHNGRS
ncbi:MAG TPA: hypothetical protein VF814_05575 [Casimicrobiaceae bacterium]